MPFDDSIPNLTVGAIACRAYRPWDAEPDGSGYCLTGLPALRRSEHDGSDRNGSDRSLVVVQRCSPPCGGHHIHKYRSSNGMPCFSSNAVNSAVNINRW